MTGKNNIKLTDEEIEKFWKSIDKEDALRRSRERVLYSHINHIQQEGCPAMIRKAIGELYSTNPEAYNIWADKYCQSIAKKGEELRIKGLNILAGEIFGLASYAYKFPYIEEIKSGEDHGTIAEKLRETEKNEVEELDLLLSSSGKCSQKNYFKILDSKIEGYLDKHGALPEEYAERLQHYVGIWVRSEHFETSEEFFRISRKFCLMDRDFLLDSDGNLIVKYYAKKGAEKKEVYEKTFYLGKGTI